MGRKKNRNSKRSISSTTINTSDKNSEVNGNLTESVKKLDLDETKSDVSEATEEVTNQKSELVFDTYSPNSERYQGREYFVQSLCQQCKRALTKRVPCSKCALVHYCSEEHKRAHWAEHAELCAAAQAVCRERGETHLLQSAAQCGPEEFRALRYRNMQDCQARVGRALESWEREIFVFPAVCGQCRRHEVDVLEVCKTCGHSAFCPGHRPSTHDRWCAHLLRYRLLVEDQSRFGVVCLEIPLCRISSTLPKLTNIEEAFKNVRNRVNDLEFLELTEILTYPLTVFNALCELDDPKTFNCEKLVLHVVGAERDFEISKLEKWEYYVLHLMPRLKRLEVEFIGPELNYVFKNEKYKPCRYCVEAGKYIHFGFHNRLYHTLPDKPMSSRPDLICAFNPGLYRSTGFDSQDSWSPSIVSMFTRGCPVLSTAYTHREVHLDVDRVRATQQVRIEKEPALNPFSSRKPSLNFVSDEDSPVIFKNHFYCIMTKA